MSKSVKIQDSPEFKEFKENFEATMDVMEKDPEFAQMKLPEEWERDFKETMEATWEKERQKKKKRIGKRIAIAAGVTLVTLAGLNLGVQQVQGEGLVEFFQRTFNLDNKQYMTVESENNFDMDIDEGTLDTYFYADSIKDLNMQLHEAMKTPMFYTEYIPEGYTISEVRYSRSYNIIYYLFKNGEKTIHVSQMRQYDEVASGNVTAEIEYGKVDNKNLGKTIIVYQSVQDNSVSFSIEMNNIYFTVNCLDSLEEVLKIAENIDYY